MEFQGKTQRLLTCLTVLDAVDEKPVDADVVLPDYCPDVAAVLGCELMPTVAEAGMSGDRLTAEGTALVRVLYLDENRDRVHTYEVSQAFSASFLTDGRQGETAVTVTTDTEYIHCRAVSPRRLDIHGAFRVRGTVTAAEEQTVLLEITEESVFTKTEPMTTSVPAGHAEKPFSINEHLKNAAAVDSVIRSFAVPTVSETKVLAGKIIVKGDLHICTVTQQDREDAKTAEERFTLPFSQMLDLAGAGEETTVQAQVRVLSHSVRIEEDKDEKSLYATTKLGLSAQAWREETAVVITDAYATTMPVELQTVPLTGTRLVGVSTETIQASKTLDLPPEVREIRSVWCEASALATEIAQDNAVLSGRLLVHLLAADEQGQLQYFERPVEFEQSLPAKGTREEDVLSVVDTNVFTDNAGQMTAQVTLNATRRQFEETRVAAVTEITGNEDAAYPAEEAAVKMVYADAGESLWNVAKATHTSVEALKEENELESEALSKRTMLLIPLA